jgi:hypothetical protein
MDRHIVESIPVEVGKCSIDRAHLRRTEAWLRQELLAALSRLLSEYVKPADFLVESSTWTE